MQIFTHKISLCSSLLFGADPAAPMNIKVLTWQKILSKLLKNLHIRTSYTFLSVSRIFRHEWILDSNCDLKKMKIWSCLQHAPKKLYFNCSKHAWSAAMEPFSKFATSTASLHPTILWCLLYSQLLATCQDRTGGDTV